MEPRNITLLAVRSLCACNSQHPLIGYTMPCSGNLDSSDTTLVYCILNISEQWTVLHSIQAIAFLMSKK